ncbi:MAG: cytochrome c peroxidase [Nitrospirota bacterium]
MLIRNSAAALFAISALFLATLPAYAAEKQPSIALGKKLFEDKSLGTSGKSCASCHKPDAIGGLAAKKSWFGEEAKTLEQAINVCITGPLAGKALPEGSVEAKSMAMYMRSMIK